MSRYEDDLLESREFYQHNEEYPEGFSGDETSEHAQTESSIPNEFTELQMHQDANQNRLVRKPNWDNYTRDQLDEILLTLKGIVPPSRIEDGIYISK